MLKKLSLSILVAVAATASFTFAGEVSCEKPESLTEVDGFYQIGTCGDLLKFAEMANANRSINGMLTADIVVNTNVLADADGVSKVDANGNYTGNAPANVWTPIGTSEKPYKGTFDGNGHTIRGLYFNGENTEYVGLFGYISGSTAKVQNVGVVDSYFKGYWYVGGVVGFNDGTVSNVYNTGSVSGKTYVGGVVGFNFGTVSNVYNTGSVSGSGDRVGGVVGFNFGTVSNVYNTGSVSGDFVVGGVVGKMDGGDINKAYYDKQTCNICNSYGTGEPLAELATLTIGSKADDKADFPLLKGETESPWAKGIYYDKATGKLANSELPYLKSLPKPQDVEMEFNVKDNVIQISSAEDLKNFAKLVNEYHITDVDAELTTSITLNSNLLGENNANVDAETGEYKGSAPANVWTPIGTDEKPYKGTFDGNGHTIRGLYFNDENTNYVGLFGYIYGSNAIVQNVGVVDSYLKGYLMVGGVVGYNAGGTVSNVYNTGSVSGDFDVGGVVGGNDGTVSNVYNTGYVSGTDEVGGVVGYNDGTVSNVYNTGSVSGDKYVGGVVGFNFGTVSNVYNTGSVSGKTYVGGVVGYNAGGTVSNVYNTGSVSGDSEVGGVVGYNDGTVSNGFFNTAYYSGNAIGAGSGTANTVVGKTSTELANLTVGNGGDFPLLEGETKSPWITGSVDVGNAVCKFPYLQVFGEASQPQFNVVFITITNIDGGAELGVVAVNPNSKISLADVQVMENGEILSLYKDVEGVPTEWNFENDVVTENVTLKAKYIGVLDGVYQIASAQDLMNFASIVNGGTTTASAVLTQDICLNACDENESVLKADGTLSDDASNFAQWTPIGTSEKPYNGTFDGNGHTIRGLYFNDENTDYVGLFGYIDGSAKVQNVGVVDSYFKGEYYVGGVVGANYGTVSNAYNTGSVNGNEDVGGVVGQNFICGTVSNVYNTGSVSGSGDYVGGVVGYNVGGTISNVYNTGSVSGGVGVGGVVGFNDGAVSNGFFNTAYYSGNAIGGGSGFANNVVGKTSTELAALNVATAFEFAAVEGNPWTMGSKVSGDGTVTYKFPYLTAFGAKSQPVLSPAIEFAAGNASATVYGATTDAVNIPADVEVSGDITFNRAFPDLTAEDAFSTIMLPFEPASKPADVTFYTIVSVSEVNGKWKVSAVVENGDIAANTPYLVRVASGTKSITFNGGTFKATEGEHSVTSGNWKFVGTYEYKAWPKNDPGIGKAYGFAGSNGNDPAIVGKFAKVGAGAYIYPMRAYLEYNAPAQTGRPAANGAKPAGNANTVASLPDEIDVVIVDKDEKTGEQTTKVIGTINTRTGEFKFANDRWFDLNGRYLGNKKPTQKGAYYNNGKKVIVK